PASGTVVTPAAVAIGIVVRGFAAGDLVARKEVGVGMAVAVLLDVTVVRGLLLPATMTLLGRWNWWPSWRDGGSSGPGRARAPRGRDGSTIRRLSLAAPARPATTRHTPAPPSPSASGAPSSGVASGPASSGASAGSAAAPAAPR